mmetsp:Transcript_80804/g.224497  ORF Transcript_80804/g.224497 Transcript_80804/m.224497 type:complete len:267 (+) Transcript_80804:338-1138(+)
MSAGDSLPLPRSRRQRAARVQPGGCARSTADLQELPGGEAHGDALGSRGHRSEEAPSGDVLAVQEERGRCVAHGALVVRRQGPVSGARVARAAERPGRGPPVHAAEAEGLRRRQGVHIAGHLRPLGPRKRRQARCVRRRGALCHLPHGPADDRGLAVRPSVRLRRLRAAAADRRCNAKRPLPHLPWEHCRHAGFRPPQVVVRDDNRAPPGPPDARVPDGGRRAAYLPLRREMRHSRRALSGAKRSVAVAARYHALSSTQRSAVGGR